MRYFLLSCVLGFALSGCELAAVAPKPRAYPRIEYPVRKYIEYSNKDCPFHFEYPDYAEIKMKNEPCWFDLFMPVFDARIHCSYMPVDNKVKFDDLVKDAFDIADRITERANYMEDTRFVNPHGVTGVTMHWTGPAASPFHFFLSDSTQHFFTAALYFNSKVKPDSLAPIAKFIQEDINHMISTFDWVKK